MAKILVIEDEANIRENMAEILVYEGYEVETAENGQVGVERAQDSLPDLIICDIMMPKLDGYGVLLELRNQADTAAIPFIFLTAKADRDSIRLGMNAGADDYLTKPCGRNEIVAAVSARMAKREVVDQIHEKSLEELRGSLMTILPHELRTPLTSIMGYAELLQMDYHDLDKAEIDERLELILHAGRRLFRVVENYLLYAQIEIFRRDARTMDVIAQQQTDNPGTVSKDATFQKAFQWERMEDVTIEAENVPVRIDADSLKKIVEELVDNALRFSKAGTKVTVTGEINGGVYRLRVRDAGRGMSNAQINRVGAYMQFERKLYEQQGLGLGLILARNLAELHRGRLTIQSVLAEGTTVTVELLV
ncbi:MAG: response regulator [Chloroflexi bacterium]|nr:response regulator [Chloroflexota bacterium]